MLTAVKNQFKISFLSVKYAIMREMLNKVTFISNVVFMILNNACFIIQWIVLYSIQDNIGGYTFDQILLLWGFAAGTYGVSHFLFENAYTLSETINNGKLDSFLVQPKNILLSVITSGVKVSALGDIIYGYIMLFVFGFSIESFILFTFFCITGGLILTSVIVMISSLSFWFNKTDAIADTSNLLLISIASYPDGIFKGAVRILLFTIVPVGFINYMPVWIMTDFNIWLLLIVIAVTALFILLAFMVFYKGIKNYSSSNLMSARI